MQARQRRWRSETLGTLLFGELRKPDPACTWVDWFLGKNAGPRRACSQACASWRKLVRGAGRAGRLFQSPAEGLDAPAGLFHVLGLGRIGNAEGGTEAERRALHHRHALGLQELGHEVLVGDELVAGGRDPADGAGAGGIDVERALRL